MDGGRLLQNGLAVLASHSVGRGGGEGRGVDTRVHVLRPSTSGVIQPVLEELTKRSSSFDGRHNSEI